MLGLSLSVVAKHRCSLSPSLIAIQRARALVRRRVARVVALPRPCDDVRDCARELRRRSFSGETACTRRWFLLQTSSLSLIAVTLRIRATLVHGFRGFRDATIEGRVTTGAFLLSQCEGRDHCFASRAAALSISRFKPDRVQSFRAAHDRLANVRRAVLSFNFVGNTRAQRNFSLTQGRITSRRTGRPLYRCPSTPRAPSPAASRSPSSS